MIVYPASLGALDMFDPLCGGGGVFSLHRSDRSSAGNRVWVNCADIWVYFVDLATDVAAVLANL